MTSELSPNEAQPTSKESLSKRVAILEELLRRKRASESLISFTEFTYPRYRTAHHHATIAAALEKVQRGETKRLMLLLPPRHGKSELASKRFPAYCLGLNPELQFISASATTSLAEDFGRDVRNIITSNEYQHIFPTQLAEDSQARGKWLTSKGGVFYAVGVGSAVIGRGADIFLIDDPYSSMEDAQSETIRRKVWEWYTGSVYNRLQPNGAIVLINHRMHEDDLTGRLLTEMKNGGDEWEIVRLPAIDDDGKALWPEAYPIDALRRIQRNTLPRFWSGLYQQNPTPDEGEYFKRPWFKFYDKLPPTLRYYGASDYATKDGRGDYTVHVVIGVDTHDDIYIVDVWRKQAETHIWIDQFLDLVARYKPLKWGEENGQIINSVGPFIEKRMRERRVYCQREQFPSVADKPTRARSFQARCSMGKVYFPHSAHWVADLQSELLSFPGKYDDQVDALSLIGRMLDTMVAGRDRKAEIPEPSKWDRAFAKRKSEANTANWKSL